MDPISLEQCDFCLSRCGQNFSSEEASWKQNPAGKSIHDSCKCWNITVRQERAVQMPFKKTASTLKGTLQTHSNETKGYVVHQIDL